MTAAYETLMGLVETPASFQMDRRDLETLWLQAANERLAQQRQRIPVLARHVEDLGIDEIRSFDDLVPLLFAHSTYKSYPEIFVSKGRWYQMNRWLNTVSSERIDVDVSSVRNQDDWVQRLHSAGHIVLVSSGTTGKNSFLPATETDTEFSLRALVAAFGSQRNIVPNQDRAVFVLGPKYGPQRSALHFRTVAERFGRPEARFFLTEEPVGVTGMSQAAELRRRIAAGTAKPSEIAELERQAKTSQQDAARRLDTLIDELLSHRSEPMIIAGFWAQYWTIIERARTRGVKPGEFHPGTIITGGGGTKGADLPDDYEKQILEFFGISRDNVQSGYGMSELSAACYEMGGRYRPPPWVIPMVLDDSGGKLLPLEGDSVEGRFGFFDTALDGRWGGVVTGDRVTADLRTPNLSVVPGSIIRYSVLDGGDDRLTCAGTIDAYVRGVMSE